MAAGEQISLDESIGKVYSDLKILNHHSNKTMYTLRVNCECLICGDISVYRYYELINGKRKRCVSCNKERKVPKQECNICGITFERRLMVSSKRTKGYTCQSCFASFTKTTCHDCDTIVDTINGNHSGYCPVHWSFHRVAYSMVQSSKYRAKKNNLPFDIDIEWVKERLVHCEVTGIPFELRDATVKGPKNYSNRHPYTPTIDKIKPEDGYLKSNCRIVCWWYNLCKSIYTDDFTKDTITMWIKNKENEWPNL